MMTGKKIAWVFPRVSLILMLLSCGLPQSGWPTMVRVVTLDDVGTMLEFSIVSYTRSDSGEQKAISHYAKVHTIPAMIGESVDVVVVTKGFERSPIQQANNRISGSAPVIVMTASQYLTHLAVGARLKPRILVIQADLCAAERSQWVEVRKVGQRMPAAVVWINGCKAQMEFLERGLYVATLYSDGRPIAVSQFPVRSGGDAEEQTIAFTRMVP